MKMKYSANIFGHKPNLNLILQGKFKKPPLRKVKMSTDQMLSALLGKQGGGKQDLRGNLKKAKK